MSDFFKIDESELREAQQRYEDIKSKIDYEVKKGIIDLEEWEKLTACKLVMEKGDLQKAIQIISYLENDDFGENLYE